MLGLWINVGGLFGLFVCVCISKHGHQYNVQVVILAAISSNL